MSYFLLTLPGILIIDIILISLKFSYLFICNIKPQLLLCLCKGNPQLSPCLKFHVRRKYVLHLLAGISLSQRCLISVVHYSYPPFCYINHIFTASASYCIIACILTWPQPPLYHCLLKSTGSYSCSFARNPYSASFSCITSSISSLTAVTV